MKLCIASSILYAVLASSVLADSYDEPSSYGSNGASDDYASEEFPTSSYSDDGSYNPTSSSDEYDSQTQESILNVFTGAPASEKNGSETDQPFAGYTDPLPSVTNGGVNLYPYDSEIRSYIVDAHNYARSHLVPSTCANMRKVRWDESLAIEASELVETCVFGHSTEDYGQNLMYGGSKLDKNAIDGWIEAWVSDELSDSDRKGDGYLDLDHASAVLWAKTYLVGCASKLCPNGYLTACNYYTPGNYKGQQAYVPGTPCSQCPSQASACDASGKLCIAPGDTGATSSYTTNTSTIPTQEPVTPCPSTTTSSPYPASSTSTPYPTSSAESPYPVVESQILSEPTSTSPPTILSASTPVPSETPVTSGPSTKKKLCDA